MPPYRICVCVANDCGCETVKRINIFVYCSDGMDLCICQSTLNGCNRVVRADTCLSVRRWKSSAQRCMEASGTSSATSRSLAKIKLFESEIGSPPWSHIQNVVFLSRLHS